MIGAAPHPLPWEEVHVLDPRLAQVLLVLVVIGACTALRWVVRGLLGLVVAVLWCAYVAGVLTARLLCAIEDAHYRGVERVRAYEARLASTAWPGN